ncbi:MAG: DUF3592 domain-containing protein [Spirochaetes bacterium]|nr:DUF3592 domain-containing protein [Spirochaetota bacterium]
MIKVTYPFGSKPIEQKKQQEKRKKRERYWMLLFLGGGILLIAKGGYDAYQALRSYTWPVAEGQIVSSSVEREIHPGKEPTYYPRISYVYRVDNREYTGNKIFFGEYGTGSLSSAQKIVDPYPIGKKVPVYYDPRTPENGVLERGAFWSSFAILIFGLLFVAVGLVGFLYWDILNPSR